jgi:hypothetical protein
MSEAKAPSGLTGSIPISPINRSRAVPQYRTATDTMASDMRNYVEFSAWQKFLAPCDDKLANPFAKELLGQDACFLYCETTAPLPATSMAGIWLA